MYVSKRLTFFIFSFLVFIGIWFIYSSKLVYAEIKIEKLDGMIDWGKASNYVEAKQVMALAKEINKEKRRRKQLRDAGVAEEDIKRIIQNERNAKLNNDKVFETEKKTTKKTKDQNTTNDVDEDSDEDVEVNENIVSKTYNNDDVEINNQKVKSNNQKINNYYQIEQNNKNNKKQENDMVDVKSYLNITPEIPNLQKYTNNNDSLVMASRHYDDFELSRMLAKAGENVDNPTNFAIFAKEVSKIANKPNKPKQIEMPSVDEYILDEEEGKNYNLVYSKNNNRYFANSKTNSKTKKANNSNVYKQNLANMYAVAGPNDIKQHKNKVSYAYQKGQTDRFYANKKQDEEEEVLYDSDEIGRQTMTDGQIIAKNMGAPYPYKRDKVNHNTQYQPQNIAQIAYDNNNKHLQPAMFESHIIKQVFDNLGGKNAIPLARALINKVGSVDIKDDEGNTLLMHAVARKNQSLIAMLLAEGASPNAVNNDGFTPLHLAASNGDNTAIYSLMMSGGKPNLRDNNGNTSLMYASKMCDANSVKLMMALGGDPNIENRSTGRTAFDFASENDNPTIINLLVNENKKLLRGKKPVELLQS